MAEGNMPKPFESVVNTHVLSVALSNGYKCTLTMDGTGCIIYGMRRPNVKIAKYYEYWSSSVWDFGSDSSDGALTFTKSSNSTTVIIENSNAGSVPLIIIGASAVLEELV